MSLIKSTDLPVYTEEPPKVYRRTVKQPEKERGPVSNAIGLYGSGHVARNGVEKLLGTKRVYHGTTPQAAEQIRKMGLLPQFGGKGAAAPVPEFVKASSNKCHVTTRPVVAKLFEKHLAPNHSLNLLKRNPEALVQEAMQSSVSRGGPGLVKFSIPYECFARMQNDLDMEFGYTTEKGIEPAYVKDGLNNRAERMVKLTRLFPGYVRQFPLRAAGGTLQTTAALVMVNYFGTKLCEGLQDD